VATIWNRTEQLDALQSGETTLWDVVVIGGGAAGLGAALDAVSRGYRTALFEQHDFAKGTSSRSTKLIHGGVRYLRQGNLGLVTEALRERGLLLRNAPGLVTPQKFAIPHLGRWDRWYYGAGLRLYDQLSGKWGISPTRHLSRDDLSRMVPTLQHPQLRGGTLYYDAQFDDARLAIALAQAIVRRGGLALNYLRVTELVKQHQRVSGVVVTDQETQRAYRVHARVVINATGVFSDALRRLDEPSATPMILPSQGIHLVVDHKFLPGETAIMIPRTTDGRVLFAIPWHRHTLLGTTDTPVSQICLEPRPLMGEVEYLLRHLADYLQPAPTLADVTSMFAGLRPLVRPGGPSSGTAAISREHVVLVSPSQLVSVIGGKWTTYRKMAEDVMQKAIAVANLPPRESATATISLDASSSDLAGVIETSGDDGIRAATGPRAASLTLPLPAEAVRYFVQHEMARTVEDILARRTRWLLLDAAASAQAAADLARGMAGELGRDDAWATQQAADFCRLAEGYRLEARPG